MPTLLPSPAVVTLADVHARHNLLAVLADLERRGELSLTAARELIVAVGEHDAAVLLLVESLCPRPGPRRRPSPN